MAVGDLERAVRECINDRLTAKGYFPPFNPDGTMSGDYQYTMALIGAFHSKVAECLAGKGYKYTYDTTSPAYFRKTLAMKLRDVTVAIEERTTGPGTHFKAVLSEAQLRDHLNDAFRNVIDTAGKTKKAAKKKKPKPSKKNEQKKSGKKRADKKRKKGKSKK